MITANYKLPLSSRYRQKLNIHLGLLEEAVVKQISFQVDSLSLYSDHIKRPEDLGQE